VQRAIDLLCLFTPTCRSLTVREIVISTGLPKTTVIRLLRTLTSAGLVWVGEQGVVIGPGMLRWASLATEAWQLSPTIRQVLKSLAVNCGETISIYLRTDLKRICIAQEPGPQTIRQVVRVGEPLPVWNGASSKVLLRDATEVLIARIAESSEGAVDSTRLIAAVRAARRDGFAVSHGEREHGASSVAAPIVRSDSCVVAALSASGPTSRFLPEVVERFAQHLKLAAGEISQHHVNFPDL